ncbi:MAG TPA: sigma-70 family RNA polymerase sigma factor [Robiginitalea sp.]|nr:sigma-70 family RNA polymerase sigma factor [Robiginitalea sp.]
MSDRELIDRVLAGDTHAYQGLVVRYQHMVYTLAVRMLKNRELAEEASQDVFVKAYLGLKGFRGNARFSTWLYKIAYYRILDAAGAESRRPELRSDLAPEQVSARSPDDTWTQLMESERRAVLNQALEDLEPGDRSLLSLFYLQEQSLQEVSEITGLSPGTVKVRLFRARERLKATLATTLHGKILENYER